MNLNDFGFVRVQARKDGTTTWTKREHSCLVLWLVVRPDERATLSWELALGEMVSKHRWESSAADELQLFVFPQNEVTGILSEDWLRGALDSVQSELKSFDLTVG